jgi:hypothetical protein
MPTARWSSRSTAIPLAPGTPAEVRAEATWVAGQLSRRRRDLLAGWPAHATVAVTGPGAVLVCHGSPRSGEDILTALSPPAAHRGGAAGRGAARGRVWPHPHALRSSRRGGASSQCGERGQALWRSSARRSRCGGRPMIWSGRQS